MMNAEKARNTSLKSERRQRKRHKNKRMTLKDMADILVISISVWFDSKNGKFETVFFPADFSEYTQNYFKVRGFSVKQRFSVSSEYTISWE